MTNNLEALEKRARFDLACLDYPARDWVPPRLRDGVRVKDVIIVGGGQSGVALGFKLLRERVPNFLIFDRNAAGSEGPWQNFARMHTLRTPKHVVGPELGFPALSVRAWWEAQYGPESWENLGKIPKAHWHDYLQWLRHVTGIGIESGWEVTEIEPLADGLLAIHARRGTETRVEITRNLVLTTGIEGSGRWSVPEIFARNLPRECFAHTAEEIDFSSLAGKKIAVIGAGASAFDNAAEALEHNAATVDLFVRRPVIPAVNPNRWMEFTGFLRHYADLDDARKWRFMKLLFDLNQPPPQDTYERCARHRNFAVHLASPVQDVRHENAQISLATPGRAAQKFDFAIIGTGFTVDFSARPELSRFASEIAVWSDRFAPPPAQRDAALGTYPYLSDTFQLTEKHPGQAPFLKSIFSYTFAAMPSLACPAGISALKFGIERLARGVTRNLFVEDADLHFASLAAYEEKELIVP